MSSVPPRLTKRPPRRPPDQPAVLGNSPRSAAPRTGAGSLVHPGARHPHRWAPVQRPARLPTCPAPRKAALEGRPPRIPTFPHPTSTPSTPSTTVNSDSTAGSTRPSHPRSAPRWLPACSPTWVARCPMTSSPKPILAGPVVALSAWGCCWRSARVAAVAAGRDRGGNPRVSSYRSPGTGPPGSIPSPSAAPLRR